LCGYSSQITQLNNAMKPSRGTDAAFESMCSGWPGHAAEEGSVYRVAHVCTNKSIHLHLGHSGSLLFTAINLVKRKSFPCERHRECKVDVCVCRLNQMFP